MAESSVETLRAAAPRAGDRYIWSGLAVRVTRVAADGSWADIRVQPGSRAAWGKRQPLPFPPSFERDTDDARVLLGVPDGR